MNAARCAFCASLGGNVTAAGNLNEWATTSLCDALVARVKAASVTGGTSYLEAGDRLAEIAAGLNNATGHGEASDWLAGFLLACPDEDFRNPAERALGSLLPLIPYQILERAAWDALEKLDWTMPEGPRPADGCAECGFAGCYECSDGGRS